MAPVLITAVRWLINIMYGLLLIRVLLSWMPMFRGPFVNFVYSFTEPVLAPIRRLIDRSPLGGPGILLDFSPIIAFVVLRWVGEALLVFMMTS